MRIIEEVILNEKNLAIVNITATVNYTKGTSKSLNLGTVAFNCNYKETTHPVNITCGLYSSYNGSGSGRLYGGTLKMYVANQLLVTDDVNSNILNFIDLPIIHNLNKPPVITFFYEKASKGVSIVPFYVNSFGQLSQDFIGPSSNSSNISYNLYIYENTVWNITSIASPTPQFGYIWRCIITDQYPSLGDYVNWRDFLSQMTIEEYTNYTTIIGITSSVQEIYIGGHDLINPVTSFRFILVKQVTANGPTYGEMYAQQIINVNARADTSYNIQLATNAAGTSISVNSLQPLPDPWV